MTTFLFDESHGQGRWFGASPTVDKGFSRIAALAGAKIAVAFIPAGNAITPTLLQDCRALVLVMGPQGLTRLSANEIAALHGFVRGGGGLLVLGTYTGDWHHEANLNDLLAEYGIAFNRDVILPAGSRPEQGFTQAGAGSPTSPLCVSAAAAAGPAPVAQRLCAAADELRVLSACLLYVDEDAAVPLYASAAAARIFEPVPLGIGIHIQKYQDRGGGPATLIAAARRHKVVVAGGWKLFLDAFIDDPGCDNRSFFENVLDWLLGEPAENAPLPWPSAAPDPVPAPAAALSPTTAAEAATLHEQLRRMKALLANAQKLAITAEGMGLARLHTDIAYLEQDIRQTETRLDALMDGE